MAISGIVRVTYSQVAEIGSALGCHPVLLRFLEGIQKILKRPASGLPLGLSFRGLNIRLVQGLLDRVPEPRRIKPALLRALDVHRDLAII